MAMWSALTQWWNARKAARRDALMVERHVVVRFDDWGVGVVTPAGEAHRIAWKAVEAVAIETNDGGPWDADVWWVLEGEGTRVAWPQGATGDEEMLSELPKRFPGFDHEAVISAMGCTDNARFDCWRRRAPAAAGSGKSVQVTAESPEEEKRRRVELAMARVPQVEAASVDARLAGGTVVIDVRDAQAHAAARLAGAIHLEREAFAERIASLVPDRATPILCYCNGGSRGPLAALALQELGYTDVGAIAGGLRAYAALDATGDPGSPPDRCDPEK